LCNATLRKQHPASYSIVYHKGDAFAMVLDYFKPNVALRRDLFGPKLRSLGMPCVSGWLKFNCHMGHDEFRCNLQYNGKFFIDSMYKALVLPSVQVDDNMKIGDEDTMKK
jgi:hypothetical protein